MLPVYFSQDTFGLSIAIIVTLCLIFFPFINLIGLEHLGKKQEDLLIEKLQNRPSRLEVTLIATWTVSIFTISLILLYFYVYYFYIYFIMIISALPLISFIEANRLGRSSLLWLKLMEHTSGYHPPLKKVRPRLILQRIGWIGCFILTIGILLSLTISLLLPWTTSPTFFAFFADQLAHQNFIFPLSITLGFTSSLAMIIFMTLTLHTQKPWSSPPPSPEPVKKPTIKPTLLGHSLFRWFLCWNLTWFLLASSILTYLLSDLPLSGTGLSLYLNSSQFMISLGIIIGLTTVLYFGSLRVGSAPEPP